MASYKQGLVAQAIEEQEESQDDDGDSPTKRVLLSPPDLEEDTTPIKVGTFTKRGDKVCASLSAGPVPVSIPCCVG